MTVQLCTNNNYTNYEHAVLYKNNYTIYDLAALYKN